MSSIVAAQSTDRAGAYFNHRLRRLVVPSLSDCLFIALIVWLFVTGSDAWSRMLRDGDTGWHIRTGDYILSTGSVPYHDFFSFTKPGEPWFAWEWGSAVIYSLLHQAWGIKAVAFLGGVQVALFATILFRYMLWRGTNVLFALLLTLLGAGASSIHFLSRPHMYTMLFIPIALWIVERDRKAAGKALWWLVPLTAVWTNLHGGFLAFVACLGLLVVGTWIETLLQPDRDWTRLRRYALLAGLCSAATLVNPYGWRLHSHIVSYLDSDWIRKSVLEFQSPKFRNESAFQFEFLLLLALPLCWRLLEKRLITECLWILFWTHQALGAARHITVFVGVVTPILAGELALLWDRWVEPAARTSFRKILDSVGRDLGNGAVWTSLWPVAFLAALPFVPNIIWPVDFPALGFPVAMVKEHGELMRRSRVLTIDQWSDYLIYRNYPDQRVFFDGRSDFYGGKLGDEYLALVDGHWDWSHTLDKYRIDVVLLPPVAPLTTVMKMNRSWKVIGDDKQALLFVKVPGVPENPARASAAAAPKKEHRRLMKYSPASEFSIGDPTDMKLGARAEIGPVSGIGKPTDLAPPVAASWQLPSGAGLGEFAMRSGFLAPSLLVRHGQGKPFGSTMTTAAAKGEAK